MSLFEYHGFFCLCSLSQGEAIWDSAQALVCVDGGWGLVAFQFEESLKVH